MNDLKKLEDDIEKKKLEKEKSINNNLQSENKEKQEFKVVRGMFYELLEKKLQFTNIFQIKDGCKSLVFTAEKNGIQQVIKFIFDTGEIKMLERVN